MGNYSNDYKPPKINDWVFGFFIDGRECQQPILIGTLAGMFTKLPVIPENTHDGFDKYDASFDPNSIFKSWLPSESTGEDLDQSSVYVRNVQSDGDTRGVANTTHDLPRSGYEAKYPHNRVYRSESGHVMEFDDTPGSERINMFHRSGSAVEFLKDGSVNVVTIGDDQKISYANAFEYTRGSKTMAVGQSLNIKVHGSVNLEVDNGDVNIDAHNNVNLRSAGKIAIDAAEHFSVKASQISLEATSGVVDVVSGDDVRISSGGDASISGDTVWVDGDAIRFRENGPTAEPTEIGDPIEKRSGTSLVIAPMSGGGVTDAKDVDEDYDDPTDVPGEVSVEYSGADTLKSDTVFQAKLAEMKAKYPGLTDDKIYKLIAGESSFDPRARNSTTGASGLFQFTPAVAAEYGYTAEQIRGMSSAQQLAVYDRYLDRWGYSGGSLGIMNAAPAYAGASDDTVVYKVGSAAWKSNPGWRSPNGGAITVASINNYYGY